MNAIYSWCLFDEVKWSIFFQHDCNPETLIHFLLELWSICSVFFGYVWVVVGLKMREDPYEICHNEAWKGWTERFALSVFVVIANDDDDDDDSPGLRKGEFRQGIFFNIGIWYSFTLYVCLFFTQW